nr:patched domain-containing protein 3-like [Pogona vitticeps]
MPFFKMRRELPAERNLELEWNPPTSGGKRPPRNRWGRLAPPRQSQQPPLGCGVAALSRRARKARGEESHAGVQPPHGLPGAAPVALFPGLGGSGGRPPVALPAAALGPLGRPGLRLPLRAHSRAQRPGRAVHARQQSRQKRPPLRPGALPHRRRPALLAPEADHCGNLRRLFLGFFLGGVTLGPGDGPARPLLAAKALRLVYYLQEDDAQRREDSRRWLDAFLERIPGVLDSLNFSSVRVVYFTSLSRQKELKNLAKDVIPLVSVAYFLTISFSIVSCARLDCVRTKVSVAFFGVLASGLSVISSFGLLLFCGVPFVITAANSPFLILGIGIDDMFIMVSCWQRTKVKDNIQVRMANTYAEAAVSVTITTLTDVLTFYIGIATSFPSVQSFCIYTGTAFIFCYFYNLTFLGAVLALDGRREESNRHWLTFMKVKDEPQDSSGCLYNVCCVGGSFDKSTGAETEHLMNTFFKKYYGPFIMHTWAKVSVIILYLIYLGSSFYGCIQIKEGVNLRNVATDDSYIIPYYDLKEKYFSEYGPRVMVIVTKSIAYWDPSVREDLEHCIDMIGNISYVDKDFSESWLTIYVTFAKNMSLNINDRNVFIGNLPALFTANPEYEQDVKFSATEILASRFFIQIVNASTVVDQKKLLTELRVIAEDCKIPLMVYHPAFILFDQFLVIIKNTIETVIIATGAMLIVSLLLIPNLLCSLWVAFAIVSVIVGVSGFMAYWGINLDSVSMINLVICIGFSVDYSAHISYAFVSSKKLETNERAVDAVSHLGYPILQAAASTLVGVFVLSMSSAYVFRNCFKIILLVITFGAAHGLLFIPVFLTLFGFCS